MNMILELPPYKFDSSLNDYPVDNEEWSAFIMNLLEKLRITSDIQKNLVIYEYLGMALRTARRFDEAELYLSKALALSESPSKKIQNLIRLAHVYQWEKEFSKAKALFDQARYLINENDISEKLKSAYHQHLGKFYFDQGSMGLAVTEFELALNIRTTIKAAQDQIESTTLSLIEAKKKWPIVLNNIVIRRAQISDAEAIHNAHMESINEICVKDHTSDEIRVWGGRTFDPAIRLPGIQNQFYLVAESNGIIEGFCQLKTSFKDNLKSAHLFGFYITPKILKKRVGDALMQLVFEYCESENIKLITLKSSITSFGFYQKYGFIQTGELTGLIREGVMIRCYPMRKEIK